MSKIRATAVMRNIPSITTIQGARAALKAIAHTKQNDLSVKAIQSYH